ncbi:MAG: MarR family transcriptional regulator [Bacteroidia bacterium]|nr:MarR family transcriptional regulator [Bacteroidia bacterium]
MDVTANIFYQIPWGRHLSVLTKMYFGALTKRLNQLDIDRHYSILILVENNPEGCTQQFISDEFKIDKASMVRIIDYLVKNNYLKRSVHPNDRRKHRLELTVKARKFLPVIHKEVNSLNKIVTKGMNAGELKQFWTSINKISENLKKEPTNPVIVNYKKVKALSK